MLCVHLLHYTVVILQIIVGASQCVICKSAISWFVVICKSVTYDATYSVHWSCVDCLMQALHANVLWTLSSMFVIWMQHYSESVTQLWSVMCSELNVGGDINYSVCDASGDVACGVWDADSDVADAAFVQKKCREW